VLLGRKEELHVHEVRAVAGPSPQAAHAAGEIAPVMAPSRATRRRRQGGRRQGVVRHVHIRNDGEEAILDPIRLVDADPGTRRTGHCRRIEPGATPRRIYAGVTRRSIRVG
jgi:hypothetical protein